jgi:predicted signal transduction protein with EAL and GGDEF domain
LTAPELAAAASSSYDHVLQAINAEINAPGASVALLVVDLEDISRFQARLGLIESAGLLQALSDSFVQALGHRGRIMRLGDGRFCALARGIRNEGHAVLAAEKLARTADELFTTAGVAIKPRFHIGVALFPAHTHEPKQLLQRAQIAGEASRSRGARVVVYDGACNAEILAPWELGNEFAEALDMGELSVHYQPKISM